MKVSLGPHFEIHGLTMLNCSVTQGLLLYLST